jgi:hypothetical protein
MLLSPEMSGFLEQKLSRSSFLETRSNFIHFIVTFRLPVHMPTPLLLQ